jgi:hypothetical protein
MSNAVNDLESALLSVDSELGLSGASESTLDPREVQETLAYRERYLAERAFSLFGEAITLEAPLPGPAVLVKLMSAESHEAIVTWETGGRRYYERIIGAKPHWPGGESGVTIGCGYDLGYHSRQELERDWKTHLGESAFQRLLPAIGLTGTAAKRFRQRVDDLRIPWGVALSVFDAATLPKYVLTTFNALPTLLQLANGGLHGHCVGVLASLVFNRGPSFRRVGDRYREMRAIAAAIESGERRDLETIPRLVREMKRIWAQSGPAGLLVRRDKEADLFQSGLDAAPIGEAVPEAAFSLAAAAEQGPDSPAVFQNLETLSEEERDALIYEPGSGEEIVAPEAEIVFEAPARRFAKSDVRWPRDDRNAPDYRHLPQDARGATFDFTAEDLERLIAANRFAPHLSSNGKILIGLRGCALVGGDHAQEDRTALRLKDQRPDHSSFRCVIGVYDRGAKKLWAYTASTVPNANGVLANYNRVNFGMGKTKANLLPTGCYELCVGTHFGSVQVSGVFRLGDGPMPANASKATVLRSSNDVTFGTADEWDLNKPSDNLHPAFGTDSFSSLGCMTVRGSYRGNGNHTGEWAKLRVAAGLTSGIGAGERFDIVLLTGLDAATAASMREGGKSAAEIDEALAGLRHGSQGEEVEALQSKLGLSVDGTFGPGTKLALAKAQIAALGFATGIHSVEMDGDLGFGVFGSAFV